MRSSSLISLGPILPVALAALVALGALVARLGYLGHGRAVLIACLRAAAQLGAVSLLITWVITSFTATTGFILLMYGVAAFTTGRRITRGRAAWWAAAPIAAGVAPVLALLAATGVVALDTIVVIPIAGILLGGCMTATSLAGRRAVDELNQRKGEVEAALALGFLPRDAALEICRHAASQALVLRSS